MVRMLLALAICVLGSLIATWAAGRAIGFSVNPAHVIVLSAVMGAAAQAVERRRRRSNAGQ